MPLEMKYFVLNPSGDDAHASACRAAMRCYATMIESEDPERARELREWVERERMSVFDDNPVKEDAAIRAAQKEQTGDPE